MHKFDLKQAHMTLNSSMSTKALTHRAKPSAKFESNQPQVEIRQKRIKSPIKPILGGQHERSKSSLKSFGDEVLQTSEAIKRSLANFKSDLLGLKHDERYSTETDNLVKLIQKYMERFYRIEYKYKLRNTIEKPETSKPTPRQIGQKVSQPGSKDTSEYYQYLENENFIDIIATKDQKIKELNQK